MNFPVIDQSDKQASTEQLTNFQGTDLVFKVRGFSGNWFVFSNPGTYTDLVYYS